MVAYTFYEDDTRVRRYAEALAQRGDEVDAIALRGEKDDARGVIQGVNIYRIQKRVRNERGKFAYLRRLLLFFVKSFFLLSRLHMKRRYDVVHVHNVPDFEVFAALVPKITGAKVILDIHDILPEFYANKFHARTDSGIFKALLLIEKVSTAFSDHVIISNHIWGERLRSRGVKSDKCSVSMNYPDSSVFFPRGGRRKGDRVVLIYPGSLNFHQGVDIAIKAFAIASRSLPLAEFHIYGEGNERGNLEKLAADLNVSDKVRFMGWLPVDQIVDRMASTDIGIVPKRDDSFGGEAFSTKIWEFMSVGIPVIVSRTRIDRYYFDESIVRFFTPGDEASLAASIVSLAKDQEAREELVSNAGKYIQDKSWEKRKGEYFELLETLTTGNGRIS